MSNMTTNQRNQYERIELSRPSTGVQVRDRRWVIGFTVIALLILGALCYATVQAINGWAQALVLGVIVLTTIGVMIALNPLRRG